jgi:hypothetical protein
MKRQTTPILAAALAAALGSAGAFALPASTFSGAVNGGLNLSVIATNSAAADNATVLSSVLKVPGDKKDLLIGVSLQSSLLTDTLAKGKNGSTDSQMACASLDVKVLVDGVEAAPGPVRFSHRCQTLNTVLGGVIGSCTDTNGDGVIDVATECSVTDEQIQLILDTTSANHFNFIAPNVGTGDHVIEVVADVTANGTSTATGKVAVNVGTLAVEVVRSANTDTGITIE